MRVGNWQKIYGNEIPIPETLSTAFGLSDGSQLHLAPIVSKDKKLKEVEIIVSPVEVNSWASAVRLSVRLQDRPKSLHCATEFLRQHMINILLTEACSTYKERAHWDAICDVKMVDGFNEISLTNRDEYKEDIKDFLNRLNTKLHRHMIKKQNKKYFLSGLDFHGLFSELPGLNDAHFNCDKSGKCIVPFQTGEIKIPLDLQSYIRTELNLKGDNFPQYAIITGNTEQRYLVIWFINDYENLFVTRIDNELTDLKGQGIGVLNQMLNAIPPEINLMRTSNYVTKKTLKTEKGRIEMLGHWDNLIHNKEKNKTKFIEWIESIVIHDIDGTSRKNALSVASFEHPTDDLPNVYISHSTEHDEKKLDILFKELREIKCEPILGTEYRGGRNGFGGTSKTVIEYSFGPINECVVFISLISARSELKCGKKYLPSPWLIAEEVFAWKSGIKFMVRLQDSKVEVPKWNRHIVSIPFSSNEEFKNAASKLIKEIKKMQKQDDWEEGVNQARQNILRRRGW